MSKVLWIDDSPKDLAYIVAPVVKKLWKKDIKSDMYIAGDFEKENSDINDSFFNRLIKQLNEIIASEFVNFLIEEDIINKQEETCKKYQLINNNFDKESDELSIPTSDIASTNINGISISEDIINSWKKLDDEIFISNDEKEEKSIVYSGLKSKLEEKNLLGENINNIITNIKDQNYDAVFIDMCLLKGDYAKLSDKNNIDYKYKYMLPILSMALYNAAKSNELKAYMYTSYTVNENYVDYWKKTYELVFSEDAEQNEIDFYNRKGKNTCGNELLYEKVIKDLGL